MKVFLPFVFICFCACFPRGAFPGEPTPSEARVVAVIDGDTVVLDTGQRLRYLGIDAPEVAHDKTPAGCFGNEARNANSKLVLHKKVRIQYDGPTVDSHGRLLGYVFLPGRVLVNAELLRSGHASVFGKQADLARRGELVRTQVEAMEGQRGMWAACPVNPESHYVGNPVTFVFHRPDCSYARQCSKRRCEQFGSRREILKLGYSPCRRCKP